MPGLHIVFALFISIASHQSQAPRGHLPRVEASYAYSNEMSSRSIQIKGGKLRYTYNAKNSLYNPKEIVLRQQPHYTKEDMVTAETPLSAEELGRLAKQIRSSGFLRLKPVYEGRQRIRYYSTTIGAGVDGVRRNVEFRNGPVPRPFKIVMDTIFKLVEQHFPKAPKP